jgi:hypothetical protein
MYSKSLGGCVLKNKSSMSAKDATEEATTTTTAIENDSASPEQLEKEIVEDKCEFKQCERHYTT